jgi:hypothetical protein
LGIGGVHQAVLSGATVPLGFAAGQLATQLGLFPVAGSLIAVPVRRALLVELGQRLTQPGSAAMAVRPPRRQPPAGLVAKLSVFGRVGRFRLGEDLLSDLAARAVRPRRRIRFKPGAID